MSNIEEDENIDVIWLQEAEDRLEAYRTGRSKGIPMEDVFDAD